MLQTDPEAAKVVFEAGVSQLTMVPLEVTHTALVTPAVLQRILQRQTPFLQLMQKLLIFFAQTYKEVFDFEHPPLHDPLAVFYVACPSAFTVSCITYMPTMCGLQSMHLFSNFIVASLPA